MCFEVAYSIEYEGEPSHNSIKYAEFFYTPSISRLIDDSINTNHTEIPLYK